MKTIYNNVLPFKNFVAINLFGLLFMRKQYKKFEGSYWHKKVINHESIHTQQMKETFYVFFYLLYIIEYAIKLCIYFSVEKAYYNISFEKEAYLNQNNMFYIDTRKHFAWIKYIK